MEQANPRRFPNGCNTIFDLFKGFCVGRLNCFQFYKVEAELGGDHVTDTTFLQGKSRIFKRLYHLADAKKTKVAALCRRAII